MKHTTWLLLAGLTLGFQSCSNNLVEVQDVQYPLYLRMDTLTYEGYQLAWSEEFEYEGLPSEQYWDYEEGYCRNEELQDYKKADPEHSYVKDGKLILTATNDIHEGINKWTNKPYQFEFSSASMQTKNKVAFQYGRLDIAAKIPTGRGIWPALWMRPVQAVNNKYAEIDIMEYVWGNNEQHNTVYSTTHTQATQDGLAERWSGTIQSNTLESNFHLYSLQWDEEKIEILFDNKVVYTFEKPENADIDNWPFDQPFYLKMNIAVGGGWGGTWEIDNTMFPKSMEIQYIRYYKKAEGPTTSEPEQKPEPVNIIANGNFESPFDADKTPIQISDTKLTNGGIKNYINHWMYKGPNTADVVMKIDETQGANKTNSSLFYHADDIKNWYTAILNYPIANVEAGVYEFSFYAKTNKRNSPFTVQINYYEDDSDFNGSLDKGSKYIVLKKDNGEQAFMSVNNKIFGLMEGVAGTEWQKYNCTITIPESQVIRLVFRPHVYTKDNNRELGILETTPDRQNLDYWFDELSLKKIADIEEEEE